MSVTFDCAVRSVQKQSKVWVLATVEASNANDAVVVPTVASGNLGQAGVWIQAVGFILVHLTGI